MLHQRNTSRQVAARCISEIVSKARKAYQEEEAFCLGYCYALVKTVVYAFGMVCRITQQKKKNTEDIPLSISRFRQNIVLAMESLISL